MTSSFLDTFHPFGINRGCYLKYRVVFIIRDLVKLYGGYFRSCKVRDILINTREISVVYVNVEKRSLYYQTRYLKEIDASTKIFRSVRYAVLSSATDFFLQETTFFLTIPVDYFFNKKNYI